MHLDILPANAIMVEELLMTSTGKQDTVLRIDVIFN